MTKPATAPAPAQTRARPRALLLALSAGLLSACASAPDPAERQAQFQAMMQAAFRSEGIAKVERIRQDPGQQACSGEQPPSAEVRRQLMASALATVRPPSDGKYLGDWREGEKLAQNGRGMTWTDTSEQASANGANCYNCHQISKQEVAHGTIGPSLYQYNKLHGVSHPDDPAAAAMLRYTWAKLNNSWAYNACSSMPRFAHQGLLNTQQLQHLMALLMDPLSPVNAP